MSRIKLRRFLWRWHRRVGLVAAFFVLLLSVSGILINHSHTLGFDRETLRSHFLLALYGVKSPQLTSYRLNDDWISHLGGDYLYFNADELTHCKGGLSGAVSYRDLWVVACGGELLLFTPQWEEVERIGELYDLPQPLERIGQCGENICLQSGGKRYRADIDQLSWPIESTQATWSQFGSPPESVRQSLIDNYIGQDISWERLLLDLHSGRLWGSLGVYMMDLMAILFIVLSGSGVVIWLTGRRLKNRS